MINTIVHNAIRHSESYIEVDDVILLDSIALYKGNETVVLDMETIIDILYSLSFPKNERTTKKVGSTCKQHKKGHRKKTATGSRGVANKTKRKAKGRKKGAM